MLAEYFCRTTPIEPRSSVPHVLNRSAHLTGGLGLWPKPDFLVRRSIGERATDCGGSIGVVRQNYSAKHRARRAP